MDSQQFKILCGHLTLLTGFVIFAIGIVSWGIRGWIVMAVGGLLAINGFRTTTGMK